MASGERLQKVLARGGLGSRRHAEELIAAGRVRVNGRIVTEAGTRVDSRRDRIEVDGRRITAEPIVYYMFHKPRGTVTTLEDPEGRATIADYLREIPARVYPVGRLDFHTSGALLLTNDGDLAQALLHPRRSVAKTYVAKIRGVPTDDQLEPWRLGMELPPVGAEIRGGKTRPVDVEVLRHAPSGMGAVSDDGTTWLKITLREGRNRQIHRMAEEVGLFVMRLARIAFAGLTTEGLRPGELRPLTDKELTMLRTTYQRPVEEEAVRRTKGEREPEVAVDLDDVVSGGDFGDEDSEFASAPSAKPRRGRPGASKDDPWTRPAGARTAQSAGRGEAQPARRGAGRGVKSFESRGERPTESRGPRGDKPFEPRGARGAKSFEPRGAKPFAGRGEKSFEPRGAKPFAGRGEKPFEPRGAKPFEPRGARGAKPFESRGGKPFAGRGDKPFEPRGDKPFEPRGARGAKPFESRGGKPSAGRGAKSFEPRGDKPFEPRGARGAKSSPWQGPRPDDKRGSRSSGPGRSSETGGRGAPAAERGAPTGGDRGGPPRPRTPAGRSRDHGGPRDGRGGPRGKR